MIFDFPSFVVYLLAQVDVANDFAFPGGARTFTGGSMLVHMFFADSTS